MFLFCCVCCFPLEQDLERALAGDGADDDAEVEITEEFSEKLARWRKATINAFTDDHWWATVHIVHKAGHEKT